LRLSLSTRQRVSERVVNQLLSANAPNNAFMSFGVNGSKNRKIIIMMKKKKKNKKFKNEKSNEVENYLVLY